MMVDSRVIIDVVLYHNDPMNGRSSVADLVLWHRFEVVETSPYKARIVISKDTILPWSFFGCS